MNKNTVVRRIDKTLDDKILRVQDVFKDASGKKINYSQASLIVGSNLSRKKSTLLQDLDRLFG